MSYCTIEECSKYIEEHYVAQNPLRIKWFEMSDSDKQVTLNHAHSVIETLPFIGKRTCNNQQNEFPRYPFKEVPHEVKDAECEQALMFSDIEDSQTFDDYRKMIQYGIQSYSVGNFSETLLSYSKNSIEVQYGLSSETAKRLLTPWLSGGYRIE